MFYLSIDKHLNYFIGKSTIAALIERFYDVDSGYVTIDGVNLKDLDPSWVRGELIGYINQVNDDFRAVKKCYV